MTRLLRPFALVPRRRFVGVQFGQHRSARRGPGDEVAGTRPYRPGDRRTWIDWRASARLSAARGTDEFVVREFFADQSPRVVVVLDRRPRMRLYEPPSPWLDKAATVETAVRLIAAAATAERGDLGAVEMAGGRVRWLSPRAPSEVVALRARRASFTAFDAVDGALEACFATLGRRASSLPPGSFVFVLSDFLEPVPASAWARLRVFGLDPTPVVVQDPTWEQSFPPVDGVVLPIADPATGGVADVWIGRREARRRANENEQRLAQLLRRFGRLGLDPVLLGSSDPDAIADAFGHWSDRRRLLRRLSA